MSEIKLGGNYCPKCLKPNSKCTCYRDFLNKSPHKEFKFQGVFTFKTVADAFCKVCGNCEPEECDIQRCDYFSKFSEYLEYGKGFI